MSIYHIHNGDTIIFKRYRYDTPGPGSCRPDQRDSFVIEPLLDRRSLYLRHSLIACLEVGCNQDSCLLSMTWYVFKCIIECSAELEPSTNSLKSFRESSLDEDSSLQLLARMSCFIASGVVGGMNDPFAISIKRWNTVCLENSVLTELRSLHGGGQHRTFFELASNFTCALGDRLFVSQIYDFLDLFLRFFSTSCLSSSVSFDRLKFMCHSIMIPCDLAWGLSCCQKAAFVLSLAYSVCISQVESSIGCLPTPAKNAQLRRIIEDKNIIDYDKRYGSQWLQQAVVADVNKALVTLSKSHIWESSSVDPCLCFNACFLKQSIMTAQKIKDIYCGSV